MISLDDLLSGQTDLKPPFVNSIRLQSLASLFLSLPRFPMHSLFCPKPYDVAVLPQAKALTVQGCRVFLASPARRLIKIDVEGMETNVVLGAMRAIYQLLGTGLQSF